MPLQGLNITVTVYRRNQEADDEVGGSKQRRTPIRTGIPARIGATRSPMSLRVQGMEATNLFDCTLQAPDYTDIDVRIDDIVVPEVGQYTGMDFVVLGVQEDSSSDDPNQDYRRHKNLSLRRIVEARRIQ